MTQQTRIDRYLFFGRRKIRSILGGLRLSALRGRLIGPRVLMNSIPKAGTHLLEQALDNFPLLRNASQRTLRGWQSIDDTTLKKIAGLKRGVFIGAHLPAHPLLISLVEAEDIKVLLMIRDPRDIIVSNFKYVTYIDLTHRCHEYYSSLPDDDTRLLATIHGVDGLVSPIDEVLSKFEGWLDQKNTLIVRFEDLIGSRGGGDTLRQLQTIRAIAKHLNIELSEEQCKAISKKTFSTTSLTFRKGKIGTWRDVFKPYHIEAFRERAGDLLVRYGYEVDSYW
jgi:hypothetical protein